MTSKVKLNTALEKLYSLHQFGIKLGLESTKKLLAYLGNPEKRLQAIHIAGSNGKGSTASFMNSILMTAGYKTGLYTSPHYVKFNERIRINGAEIPDEYIIDFVNDLSDYIDKNSPTFFELTTAMAFQYFTENQIDYAVIETGLGGRLDSTNVLSSFASVITTISKEHTNVLTDDIKKIAWEKGSIIKKHSKAFVGIMPDEAKEVIRKMAFDVDAKFYDLADYIMYFDRSVRISMENFKYTIHKLPLIGSYQKLNAALAVFVLKETLGINDWKIFSSGLQTVIINSGVQGRYEIYNEQPKIIFDSAHNPQSIELFLKNFNEEKNNYKKLSVLFGCMKDKDFTEMLRMLAENFDEIYVTKINYERAAKTAELLQTARRLKISVSEISDPVGFVANFKNKDKDDCLVVLGSIYLLGEIKERLTNNLS